jgi:2-dehydro-3-deoxygalactonokinase
MTARFIAGDWGTSHLRLSLCGDDVLDMRSGPGVAALDHNLAETFSGLCADWDGQYGILPAVLCGMAGSTLGWREVPYLACPVHPENLAKAVLTFEHHSRAIAIGPGLSCTNRLDAPDVMRGEETQILGAVHLDADLQRGMHLICLPGTHTKWVRLREGVIEDFQTALSGELFEIVRANSVLVRTDSRDIRDASFRKALEQTVHHPGGDLLHVLFETRSRQLTGEMSAGDAVGYLSGLVVGHDVAGAARVFRSDLKKADGITIVGTRVLCNLYREALALHGLPARLIEGATASLAGLRALHDALSRNGFAHAS